MSLDPQEEKTIHDFASHRATRRAEQKDPNNIEQIAKTVTEQQEQLAKDRAEFASDRQTFTRAMLQVEDYLKHKADEYERRTEQVELVYLKAVQGATLHSLKTT